MVTPEEIARAMAVHSVDDEGDVQIESEETVAVVPADGNAQQK
jgi:hypothetical protein